MAGMGYVAELCHKPVRCDVRLRMDGPLTHKFRVACRTDAARRRLLEAGTAVNPTLDPDGMNELEGPLTLSTWT